MTRAPALREPRRPRALAAIALGLVAAGGASSQESQRAVAPYRATPITLDGRLDEWGAEPTIVLDRAEQVWSQRHDPSMRWEGVDDLSASFWLSYDAAHLYVGGEVRDDDLVPGRVGGEWHNGDAIELFLDLGDAVTASGEFDEGVFQLFLMPFSEERPWGVMDWRQRPAVPSGANLTGVRAVFHRDPDAPGRYSFEAVVPFHNFPRIRGKQQVGFSIAVDDHDAQRPGRYQYVTWSGEQLIDARQRLGVLEFAGPAPLVPSPSGDAGGYGWLVDSLPAAVLAVLALIAVGLVLWGWTVLGRRVPIVRPLGSLVGIAMFVVGLLLPGWLIERRLDGDRQELRSVVETLQTEVPRMEGSLLGGYRGTERDRVLVDLLGGGAIVREQEFRYTFQAAIAGAGPAIGAGTRPFRGLGFEVRPYGIPLPFKQLELFGFREPLPSGRLNVVVARPLGTAPTFLDAIDATEPADDVIVLSVVSYGPQGRATESTLEVPGPFLPSDDPLLDRMEVSYKTLTIDGPLESIGIACRQGDGVRLVGLTWVSPEGREPEQRPLFLGADTIGGVPTDLRGPYPRTAGVELRENGGTAAFVLPRERAADFGKLWLVYSGVYRSRPADPLGVGSHVCELTVEFAEEDVPPKVVPFQHQQTMFFGQDRTNRELPKDGEVRVAQRWEGEDNEARVDFVRQIDLPSGGTPVALRLRNTGPYAIRFRSAVFGTEVPTVATSATDSPLVRRDGGGEVLRPEILERIAGVDFAVYRNGRLTAATFGAIEQQERGALPDEARRIVPDGPGLERAVATSDGVVHESYAVLRGEAWSGAVLGAFRRDRDHDTFVVSVNRLGASLWLGALPVLLLIFSEVLAVLNNLRLRLVSVLSVATLVPLVALSLVLVRVLEGDHEARLRDRAQQAIVSAEKQLGEEKAQLLVNAKSWLQDLVAAVRERQLLDRPDVAAAFEQVLRPMMQNQMPPAWGASGYLQFEFNPPPDGERLGPVSVYAGGESLRSLDTQLRADVGVYLVWSVPLIGVRCSADGGADGTFALSVARQLDAAFLSALGREKAIVLCDGRGYPVAVAGSEAVSAEELEEHARRPGVQGEREEILRSLVAGKAPGVRRHASGRSGWLASYAALLDLQGSPRLLLGLVDEDTAATLPLAIGRVPVRTFFLGAAGLLLVLSLFLSFVVSTRISRPIERLERGAQALGRGEFDVQIESDERGQIGRLTRSFNQMATDLRARIQDLRLLNRGTQELTSKLELSEVVASAAAFYARHSPSDSVRLLLGDPEAEHVEVGGEDHATVPSDGKDVRTVLGATGPFSIRFAADGSLARAFPRSRSAVGFPLLLGGRARGVVLLLFESTSPSEVDLDLLWTMAAQVAAAIENARLYQVAVEDVHTGALRRDYFATRLADEVALGEKEGRALCLLGLRVDGARALCTELGAERVRRLCGRMVSIVRETVGRDCLVCRCGELELQVLLHATRAEGDEAAAALAANMRGLGDEFLDGRRPIAIEFGIAMYPDEAASAEFLFAALEARMVPGAAALPRVARDPGAGVVLSSAAMAGVLRTIERVAPTDLSVLLLGETGTGKEVLADLIHRWSKRAAGPLIKVHCAALPETLLASELFGHEKGAFTGADSRKLGRFEQAHRGTIFLDEIGEITLDVQVKLLRVLQEREIDRVGGTRPVPVDVRIVAATNRDIERMVADGRFREDLYYRLQGMMVRVPPLRERKEEIPALVEMFRREAVTAGHTRVEGFAAEAMDELFRHDWPGNVRELRNTVLRAMVLASGPRVGRADVLGITRPDEATAPPEPDGGPVGVIAQDRSPPVEVDARPEAAGSAFDVPPPLAAVANAAPPHLAGRLLRLYQLVSESGTVSSQEYGERLGLSSRTALRDLARLTEDGVLERIGRRRGARYRIVASGKDNCAGEKGS